MIHEPVCSIIVISYNNFDDTTGPCLQSLIQSKAAMEIIIVDNASDDYTISQLKKIAYMDKRIQIHLNKSNRGYAGGNNDGVQIASSNILILLNNDTIAPTGSIENLTTMLNNNPNWDMLGPMTNACGNDQQIFTTGSTPDEILLQGKTWCKQPNSISYSTDLLGFFCIAIRKEIYEHLSGLDKIFGLGFYEDTDFCFRAFKKGLKMVITEDIFIYHKGSATFSRIPKETKHLLKTNRKQFKKKHQTLPTTLHARKKNLLALERYQSFIIKHQNHTNLHHRIYNRLQTAIQLTPNNPLKKYFYKRKLEVLQNFFYKHTLGLKHD